MITIMITIIIIIVVVVGFPFLSKIWDLSCHKGSPVPYPALFTERPSILEKGVQNTAQLKQGKNLHTQTT